MRLRLHSGRAALLALCFMVAIALAFACGGNGEPMAAGAAGDMQGGPIAREITVFAASSLTDAFKEAGAAFQAVNPGAKVAFNFGASSALATQINEGAPADVFASANQDQMNVAAGKGNAPAPRTFATNALVVAVPKAGKVVQSFQDLARPGTRVVLATRDVPVGQYSREALRKAAAAGAYGADFDRKAMANVRSEEANARSVLTKVQLGEADAAIVYTTDISAAAGDVRSIEIPAEYNVVAEYPIAALKDSRAPAAAQAFVDFILGPAGRAILARHGFGPAR